VTDQEKLDYMKLMLEETASCRVLTDAQLAGFLTKADGDADAAIYHGALAKAKVDGISLPDGTSFQSSREYWMAIAAAFRPNRGGVMKRADGR
jgi:hypothetical protein